ncbi:ATP-binding cassette, subfamily B, MsbA [Lutibacter oricola]|uniref:ATP-binding cassette, subfamily B, MsbA n=1 Tax=Lutibacter oricola TaxID=762486 RepID=A0A1H3ACM9_9FLAO|nr:ABC transporter ATP-binding protein [Lutibacter oricola]SDX26944.1 ATP-binding cassette, subfamily B, MsbA [Lutibacter oricola]
MSSFKKVISYTKPYRKFAILNIIFNILYAVFNVLSVLGFIPVLGILFGQEEKVYEKPVYTGFSSIYKYVSGSLNYKVTELIDTGGIEQALLFICILSFSLFFFKNISRYLASFFLNFLRNGVTKDLRDGIYNKILILPLSFFSEKKKGDIIARMTSDIQEIEFSFLKQLEVVVREPLTVIFTLISMFAISVKLTLFVFILLPVSGGIIAMVGKKLKANSILAQQETGNFVSFIEETLTGLRVIKGFNAEDKIGSKFTNSTTKFKSLMNSVLHRKTLASPMSEFLGSATIIAILYFGGRLVLTDASPMKPEEFFGYIGLFYLVLNPAKAISTASYEIQKGTASAERIFSIIDTKNTIVDKENALDKTTFENIISFEDISFKYRDEYVLKNFSLDIKKGETVALVGQSGSGKSTLANLITRFYDINKGAVKIDGTDIRDLKQKSLRNLMGIVTQDSILFNDSVKNNICLGVEHASDEDILKASEVANAYEFIKNLPEQFETNIGDSGNTLSGGQKQRLSIARAVLKNPPIMVLDEATSALDTESEQLVQKALEEMTKNRTSLVIAHRLSTIQNADKIVVLRKGEIVEQGKHDELLANKGEYYKLVTMQSL